MSFHSRVQSFDDSNGLKKTWPILSQNIDIELSVTESFFYFSEVLEIQFILRIWLLFLAS